MNLELMFTVCTTVLSIGLAYIAFKKNEDNQIKINYIYFRNAFRININPSDNILINNEKGIIISYTLENDKISEIILKENEVVDDLQLDDLKLIQNKSGYKFSTDSVLLANFGKAKQNDIYVDLCSGSGVVAILFSCKNKIKKSYAVELQPQLADMASRSIEYNGLADKIEV